MTTHQERNGRRIPEPVEKIIETAADTPPNLWPALYRRAKESERKSGVVSGKGRVALSDGDEWDVKGMLSERARIAEALHRGYTALKGEGSDVSGALSGFILFGSFTGKSYGVVQPQKVIDVSLVSDIDMIPCVNRPVNLRVEKSDLVSDDPLFGSGAKSGGTTHVRKTLSEAAGKPVNLYLPVCLTPAHPWESRHDLELVQRCILGFKPHPWHFIGDEPASRFFGDLLEEFKATGLKHIILQARNDLKATAGVYG
ncbi:Uncharacterised protein [uncultured archaeon]|nr:Uncharacterised protein [uncultured archaeon]